MNTRHILCAVAFAGACIAVTARLPEPCNIYYGEARGPHGVTLTGGTHAVIARVNGAECTRHYVGEYAASNANYAVRIPLDDGWDARYDTTAARIGEQPVFSVQYDGDEFAVNDLPPAVAGRATIHRFDFEAVPEPLCLPLLCAAFAALIRMRQ